jgi:hypothetical protein
MHLSIQKIINLAVESIKNNLSFFLGITLVFFTLTALLEAAMLFFGGKSMLLSLLLGLIGIALFVKQAVVIHRSVILKEANRWDQLFSWGSPDNQFFLMVIGMWILVTVVVAVVGGLFTAFVLDPTSANTTQAGFESDLYAIFLPLMLIAGIIFSRICLVLPSRAIGKNMAIETSYRLTKGNAINMFLLIVMLPLATNLLLGWLLSDDVLIYNLLIGLIAHLLVVFQVSLLSHTYMALVESIETDKTELDA